MCWEGKGEMSMCIRKGEKQGKEKVSFSVSSTLSTTFLETFRRRIPLLSYAEIYIIFQGAIYFSFSPI
jgi:hypothetical protein